MAARNKRFYVIAEVKGSVHVLIDAPNKTAAIARLKDGAWDDVYDVSLETVGPVQVIAP